MKKELLKNRISTIFLKCSLIGIGGLVGLLCVTILPTIYYQWSYEFPEIAYVRLPMVIGLGLTAVAFFTAVYQSWRLLDFIDSGVTFSAQSVQALEIIGYAALIVAALYVAGMPVVYHIAQSEDAPGLIVYAALFIGIPLTIAVFSHLVKRLLTQVIIMKSENDLTV